MFNTVAKDVVDRTLDGYNGTFGRSARSRETHALDDHLGTILCYGQTGAGKTHTMTGFAESYQNRGIIPRSLQHLYQEISARSDFSYSVR